MTRTVTHLSSLPTETYARIVLSAYERDGQSPGCNWSALREAANACLARCCDKSVSSCVRQLGIALVCATEYSEIQAARKALAAAWEKRP